VNIISKKSGGAFRPLVAQFFPKAQVIDTIQLTPQIPTVDKFFLNSKYVQEGLSSKEIAKLTFSSRSTVTNQLNKFGIPLKKVTRRVNGGHVFGFRKYGGKSIELKKEQEVMLLVKSYRASGFSYQKIADLLNDKKVQTKVKKGCWYPKVVRQIFLRSEASSWSQVVIL
jgi:transposase